MFTPFPKFKSSTIAQQGRWVKYLVETQHEHMEAGLNIFGNEAALHRREQSKWLVLKLFLTADK